MSFSKRRHPHLLEINAFIFLERLRKKYKRRLTLAGIPPEEWRRIRRLGFDYIWVMGVWQRSAAARDFSLTDPGLQRAYDKTLGNWCDTDVAGSPYAVYSYMLDPQLGREGDLFTLRRNLNKAGLGLILDYVPNHVALDHPRTVSNPACFVLGNEEDIETYEGLFFQTPRSMFMAHGKDPFFSPWRDTAQVNFFAPAARAAALEELEMIARVADGVRCDMAMLALNRVFENTWGKFVTHTPRPEKEYWMEIISEIKSTCPGFIFMAEAYWDLEWELQQLGFDFTYDKKLYDRLLHASPADIRGHLRAELSYQDRCVRFIENHDEPRALSVFGPAKSRAAAVVTATIPGHRLFHDGQMSGRKMHLSVHLRREPEEEENPDLTVFYEKLLSYADDNPLHVGTWQLLDAAPAWEGNRSCKNILAWIWTNARQARLIAVNYSSEMSQGRLWLSSDRLNSSPVMVLRDRFSGAVYERDIQEIKEKGLYIELGPWEAHGFEFE